MPDTIILLLLLSLFLLLLWVFTIVGNKDKTINLFFDLYFQRKWHWVQFFVVPGENFISIGIATYCYFHCYCYCFNFCCCCCCYCFCFCCCCCLLQMIFQRTRPLATDYPEDPASCKWSSGGTGLLQMIIRHPCHHCHLCQDPDSISRTFLEQFVLFQLSLCLVCKICNICKWCYLDVFRTTEMALFIRQSKPLLVPFCGLTYTLHEW